MDSELNQMTVWTKSEMGKKDYCEDMQRLELGRRDRDVAMEGQEASVLGRRARGALLGQLGKHLFLLVNLFKRKMWVIYNVWNLGVLSSVRGN